MKINKVFVYGTLRRGLSRNGVLQRTSEFIGVGTCKYKKMFDLGSFPAVINSDDEKDVIVGELYEMRNPEEVLSILDSIEGVPHLYRRDSVKVNIDGKEIDSWLYIYNTDKERLKDCEHVKSGDYSDRLWF